MLRFRGPNNPRRGSSMIAGYAPRVREGSVRPRHLIGASGRPLNFTVSDHNGRHHESVPGQ
jgi:hypothetical protein